MRIVSWNVNGLRACAKKGFGAWLDACGAEIVGVQEVRARREDLPEEIREKLTFHLVEELGEALAHTLRGGEYREGRLQFTGSPPKKGSSPDLQH